MRWVQLLFNLLNKKERKLRALENLLYSIVFKMVKIKKEWVKKLMWGNEEKERPKR